MVFHLVTLGLTSLILYISSPGSDLFSWHPALMTIAFCLLMAQVGVCSNSYSCSYSCYNQAIVIFSPESSLLASSTRSDKVCLIGYLTSLAS